MDMKRLEIKRKLGLAYKLKLKAVVGNGIELPESGTRTQHVLAQSTHDAVGARAVLEDGHRSFVRLTGIL